MFAKQQHGYTLFEIAIICVVITVLLLAGLKFIYTKNNDSIRMEKFKKPIHALLYAANDWYQYNCYPNICTSTPSVTLTMLYTEHYLDELDYQQLLQNSYGFDFSVTFKLPTTEDSQNAWIIVNANLKKSDQKPINYYRIKLGANDATGNVLHWYLLPTMEQSYINDNGQARFKRLLFDKTLS
jgi:hypothetical protein